MNAYPRWFLPLLWTGLSLLVLSGVLLAPGIFELRLEWEVPVSLPGGSRTVIAAVHAFCAFILLVLIGALLPVHVRSGLRIARNFASGIVLLTALATLAITGWAIYYVINEDLSAFASLLHLGAGISGIVPMAVHAVRGRRIRRERQASVTALSEHRADRRIA